MALILISLPTYSQTPRRIDFGGFGVYAAANSNVKARPDAVLFGDSITQLWFEQDSAFFKANNYLGRGIGGQTTSSMLIRFRQDVIELNPKIVVILGGTNDVAENGGPIELKNVLGNIKSMCELTEVHGIIPVICSVTPCNRFYWREDLKPAEKIIALNDLLREYALSEGITYVDYHTPMREPDGSMPEKYAADGCHPTLLGYQVMESILEPCVESLLR